MATQGDYDRKIAKYDADAKRLRARAALVEQDGGRANPAKLLLATAARMEAARDRHAAIRDQLFGPQEVRHAS